LVGGAIAAYSGGSFMNFDVRSLLMAIIGLLAALFCYRSYAMRGCPSQVAVLTARAAR